MPKVDKAVAKAQPKETQGQDQEQAAKRQKLAPSAEASAEASRDAAAAAQEFAETGAKLHEQDVPIVRPTASTAGAAASAWPRWEDPGDEGASMVNTHQTMKALVPWLRQELPAVLANFGLTAAAQAVEKFCPLAIEAVAASSDLSSSALSSYKETWNPANCKVAIESASMYEAGGNLMWLDPGFVGEAAALLHPEPAWGTVVRYREQYFSRKACVKPADADASSNVGQSTSASLGRILFPCVLEAYSDDAARDWSQMPTSMRLLGGQAIVLAWYLAAGRAMLERDDDLLKMLWQAALTCTIRVQAAQSLAPTISQVAWASLELSEKYVSFVEMADTFIHWAAKVARIMADGDMKKKSSAQIIANSLRDKGLKYRGTPVNKQMVLCVGTVHDVFDETSLTILGMIEREFGRDVLSNGYHKLNRFMAVIKTQAVAVAAPGKTKEAPLSYKTNRRTFSSH